MPILASDILLHENKKNPVKNENRNWFFHNLWFQVQHYPFWTKLIFACRTETLGSLYSHAVLIMAKSSQFLQLQKSSDAWAEV